MDYTIKITSSGPLPRVLNLRQYSQGVDTVTFILPDTGLTPAATACIRSRELVQQLDIRDNQGTITALWTIAGDFTAEAGYYDLQLQLSEGDKLWLSDRMLLIVSESTSGSIPAKNLEIYGNYDMDTEIILTPKRLLINPIILKEE